MYDGRSPRNVKDDFSSRKQNCNQNDYNPRLCEQNCEDPRFQLQSRIQQSLSFDEHPRGDVDTGRSAHKKHCTFTIWSWSFDLFYRICRQSSSTRHWRLFHLAIMFPRRKLSQWMGQGTLKCLSRYPDEPGVGRSFRSDLLWRIRSTASNCAETLGISFA